MGDVVPPTLCQVCKAPVKLLPPMTISGDDGKIGVNFGGSEGDLYCENGCGMWIKQTNTSRYYFFKMAMGDDNTVLTPLWEGITEPYGGL